MTLAIALCVIVIVGALIALKHSHGQSITGKATSVAQDHDHAQGNGYV